MKELDDIIRKFWDGGYAALDEREKRILAYGYTATMTGIRIRRVL